MTTVGTREIVDAKQLVAPACPLPRPGEAVVWYAGSLRRTGTLLGSLADGRPYIRREDGDWGSVESFDAIRLADPDNRVSRPAWSRLPDSARICRPADDEQARLRTLACHKVGRHTHGELAEEIRLHGFEAFFTGASLRAALAGEPVSSAEIITTMPPARLRRIILNMYGAAKVSADGEEPGGEVSTGKIAQSAGLIRAGGLPESGEPAVEVRGFRFARPFWSGSPAAEFVFGACFSRDMEFGDFSVNAIYYDPCPKNNVLIDPSGHGLDDLAACCLRLVMKETEQDPDERAPSVGAEILRRYLLNDHLCDEDQAELLRLVQSLSDVDVTQRAAALGQRLFRGDIGDRATVEDRLHGFFTRYRLEEYWRTEIQPLMKVI